MLFGYIGIFIFETISKSIVIVDYASQLASVELETNVVARLTVEVGIVFVY